jgi:hypothetical protein
VSLDLVLYWGSLGLSALAVVLFLWLMHGRRVVTSERLSRERGEGARERRSDGQDRNDDHEADPAENGGAEQSQD